MNVKILGVIAGVAIVVASGWMLMGSRGAEAPTKLADGGPASSAASAALPDDTSSSTMPKSVTLKTNRGDIVLELAVEPMPITTGNFLKLAREGFYNGTKFHRVIKGFMIQGGDPNSKGDDAATYGTGGPGYTIADEFVAGLSNVRGTISMANTGAPNSGGSQFFINLVDNVGLDYNKPPLGSSHPVFGKVVSGMDVVDAIGSSATGPRDVPLQPVTISEIVIGE